MLLGPHEGTNQREKDKRNQHLVSLQLFLNIMSRNGARKERGSSCKLNEWCMVQLRAAGAAGCEKRNGADSRQVHPLKS